MISIMLQGHKETANLTLLIMMNILHKFAHVIVMQCLQSPNTVCNVFQIVIIKAQENLQNSNNNICRRLT